jgi:5'-3' exonuclease
MNNLIIDGTQLLMANLAVNDDDYTNDSEYLGGMTGLVRQIAGLINSLQPRSVFVTFDTAKSKYRTDLYPAYKAGRRAKLSDELKAKFEYRHLHTSYLKLILPMLGVHLVLCDEVEADDIIANFVKQSGKLNTIISTDKDFIQLVNERTRLYRPIKSPIMVTYENVTEYLGTDVETYLCGRILEGDVSDNIIGTNGVGMKTALKIFKEAGSTNPKDILSWARQCKHKFAKNGIIKSDAFCREGVTLEESMEIISDLNGYGILDDDFRLTEKYELDNLPHVSKEILAVLRKSCGLIYFIEHGYWDLNRKLMDLNYAPKIDVGACIQAPERDYDGAVDFLLELKVDDLMLEEDMHWALTSYDGIK